MGLSTQSRSPPALAGDRFAASTVSDSLTRAYTTDTKQSLNSASAPKYVSTEYEERCSMTNDPSQWFSPVRGDEHILLGRDSPLRRIPVNIDPKQAVFLDGIRHAIEILDIGFGRLRAGLTRAALVPPEASDLPLVGAGLFLDTWAVVDAIDRFRQLYLGFPGMTLKRDCEEMPPLHDVLQPFRDLRNVGDHLAQRSDFVVAKGGAVMGELTWLTGVRLLPETIAWHCVLRPGTLRSEPTLPTAPIETTLDWPTDCICLTAGAIKATCLKFEGT